jgi:YesN/AraC family two-component response regulator
LNFSPDYLSKIYKKHTGESPIKSIIRLRINEAKGILSSTPYIDIRSVGGLVGYPDQFYFSRIFKNQTGVYPSEYKKQLLNK